MLLLKACLNGFRRLGEHKAVPISPVQLAAEAEAAVRSGAAALHVHPRRPDGAETLDPGHCAAAIDAIRAACPGVPLGLSTGLWIEGTPAGRRAAISGWRVLPDFVSVNFSEPGTVELCEMLLQREIGIEAGLWTAADARAFLDSGLAPRCVRILLEPREEDISGAVETADAISALLGPPERGPRRLLHGEGPPAWGVLQAALARGYDIRIGFEDTLVLPDGRQATSNADLVAAAAALARARGYKLVPRHHPEIEPTA